MTQEFRLSNRCNKENQIYISSMKKKELGGSIFKQLYT